MPNGNGARPAHRIPDPSEMGLTIQTGCEDWLVADAKRGSAASPLRA
jgi:hypothetical protein